MSWGFFSLGVRFDCESNELMNILAQNFPKARDRLEELRRGGSKTGRARISRSAMNRAQGDCKVM